MDAVLFLVYLVIGYVSVQYVRHRIFGTIDIYTDAGQYFVSNVINGMLLGWAAAPIALLHYWLFAKKD